jgi:hypothetical protein
MLRRFDAVAAQNVTWWITGLIPAPSPDISQDSTILVVMVIALVRSVVCCPEAT